MLAQNAAGTWLTNNGYTTLGFLATRSGDITQGGVQGALTWGYDAAKGLVSAASDPNGTTAGLAAGASLYTEQYSLGLASPGTSITNWLAQQGTYVSTLFDPNASHASVVNASSQLTQTGITIVTTVDGLAKGATSLAADTSKATAAAADAADARAASDAYNPSGANAGNLNGAPTTDTTTPPTNVAPAQPASPPGATPEPAAASAAPAPESAAEAETGTTAGTTSNINENLSSTGHTGTASTPTTVTASSSGEAASTANAAATDANGGTTGSAASTTGSSTASSAQTAGSTVGSTDAATSTAADNAPVKASAVADGSTSVTFNGVTMNSKLPAPEAGWNYQPKVLDDPNPNIANSQVNGYVGELNLANTIADLPNQQVISYGGAIGTHGADVLSVDTTTGDVTLWDNKWSSGTKSIPSSSTFAPQSNALTNAVNDAKIQIQNSNLPQDVKNQAVQNFTDGNYITNTVGSGGIKNRLR